MPATVTPSAMTPDLASLIDALAAYAVAEYLQSQASPANDRRAERPNPAPLPTGAKAA